jgi:2-polyprenyl-3-methyl-5-hydroxy-6-metoxy-1,4-benzoquinol methylase
MPDPSGPSPALFFDTVFAFQRTLALKAAIELDIFTAIGDGARTAGEIAARCAGSPRGCRILCDNMATLGFLTKTGDTYALTPDSALFLTKRSPAYLGGTMEFMYSPEVLRRLEDLVNTIRRGATPPDDHFVTEANPMWVTFARAMVPMMMPSALAMAEILDIASAGPIRILDIAAGHGMFGIVMAQRNPAAEVVALDWAPVLQVAAENARAMGVAGRHRTLAGDAFTTDYGSGYGLVLLTNFLHHFDRLTCVALLRKVAESLNAGGRVAILEFVPNEDRISPPMAAGFALTMLAATPGGDAYTLRELREMLADAGFSNAAAHPLPNPQTVIVASKSSR